jgi:hypothetical protein
MHEIAPGIHHWTAEHPNLGIDVSSYWLPALAVLLDPIAVPDGVDDIEHILLSNRHHRRDAFEARERFGATVHVPRVGLHEFHEKDRVEPYDFEQPLVGDAITPHQVTPLWPDDSVLHIPSLNALAVADGVVHYRDNLEFVPEQFMDDPEAEKNGLREGLSRFAEELDFEHLLLAHGAPIVRTGRQRLREFAAS